MQRNNIRNINIVYLPHRRLEFSTGLLKTLSKANKDVFHLSIMIYGERLEEFKPILKAAQNLGIDSSIEICGHININNYMNKIESAVNTEYEYSVKLDEDIFISEHVWDYMFTTGCDLLHDEALIVTPALSNGIPSVEDFIQTYLSHQEKQELYDSFSRTQIPRQLWGVNWTQEQRALGRGYSAKNWFDTVAQNPHYYKGLHPIRCDWDSQILMNEFIVRHISDFSAKKDFSTREITEPYLCNSVFMIKTQEWKQIIQNKSLFVDDFDEVPLNKYWKQNNKKMMLIKDCFGIHTAYNTLEGIERRNEFEHNFYNQIKDYL